MPSVAQTSAVETGAMSYFLLDDVMSRCSEGGEGGEEGGGGGGCHPLTSPTRSQLRFALAAVEGPFFALAAAGEDAVADFAAVALANLQRAAVFDAVD